MSSFGPIIPYTSLEETDFDVLPNETIAQELINIRDDRHWSQMSSEVGILTQAARRIRKLDELEARMDRLREWVEAWLEESEGSQTYITSGHLRSFREALNGNMQMLEEE